MPCRHWNSKSRFSRPARSPRATWRRCGWRTATQAGEATCARTRGMRCPCAPCAREHRVVRVTVRAFHLRIPVGALHEPDHEAPAPAAAPGRAGPSQRRALLHRLDHDPSPVPAVDFGVEGKRFEEVEGDVLSRSASSASMVKPMSWRFASVRPSSFTRGRVRHDSFALGARVARVQCGELHRHAVSIPRPAQEAPTAAIASR